MITEVNQTRYLKNVQNHIVVSENPSEKESHKENSKTPQGEGSYGGGWGLIITDD